LPGIEFIVITDRAQYFERNRVIETAIEQVAKLPLALRTIGGRRAKALAPQRQRRLQIACFQTDGRIGDDLTGDPAARQLLADSARTSARATRANHLLGKPCFAQITAALQIIQEARNNCRVVAIALQVVLHLSPGPIAPRQQTIRTID
jgi:hypothetical protein